MTSTPDDDRPAAPSAPSGDAPAIGTQVFLRPVATPIPLGFLGMTGGTTALAGLQLGWIPVLQAQDVGLVLAAFSAPLQLLAAVYGFLARDSVAGTAMGVLAGTWLADGAVLSRSVPGTTSAALGVFLVAAACCLLVPLLSAGRSKLAASAVLAVAAVRFAVTGAYELTGSSVWKTAAGVCGLVLAAVALCAALAFESESGPGRTLLSTLRTGRGRRQMAAGPDFETAGLHHEPGVRKRL